MANISDHIGVRLKDFRRRAGLTQEGLAFNAGIHVSFVSEIERNLKKPSVESLEKLLYALNVSFQEFFDFELSVAELKQKPVLDSLIQELQNRSEQEIELIYNIAKQILIYEDKK